MPQNAAVTRSTEEGNKASERTGAAVTAETVLSTKFFSEALAVLNERAEVPKGDTSVEKKTRESRYYADDASRMQSSQFRTLKDQTTKELEGLKLDKDEKEAVKLMNAVVKNARDAYDKIIHGQGATNWDLDMLKGIQETAVEELKPSIEKMKDVWIRQEAEREEINKVTEVLRGENTALQILLDSLSTRTA
jgi:hypothetical protein